TPERKVLKTDSTTLTIEEAGGVSSLSFETAAGLRVTVNTAGVEITNGTGATIKLSAATVSLNGSALEVT
ncbi:MAG TPA: baseplate assembly protein, partial [Roseiflexaceae bacterium]